MSDEIDKETREELGIGENEVLTPELLQSKLADYQKCLEQEYTDSIHDSTSSDDVKSITQDYFRRNVPAAAARIVWLALNSSSDSVQASCSKMIIQAAFNEEKDSGDPIKNLLKELANNDGKPQPEEVED